MAKRYIRINWQNRPNVATPLSAANLNKMDKGIDDIDNAIEEIYNKRVNNVVTTNPDTFLAGPVGKTLQDQITTLNNKLSEGSDVLLPLQNDWIGNLYCRKIGNGLAWIHGSIVSGDVTKDTVITTLPEGVAPLNQGVVLLANNINTSEVLPIFYMTAGTKQIVLRAEIPSSHTFIISQIYKIA